MQEQARAERPRSRNDIDFVGSSYFQRHLKILRWQGRIVQVGLLAAEPAEINTAPILSKRLSIRGFTLRPQNADEKAGIVERFRRHWMPRLEDGTVKAGRPRRAELR